ncbi:MAG: replicative DNA helicase [Spirochaetales bacterium]|nr:replicative DNA helicase [Spirochaetales bacterium]
MAQAGDFGRVPPHNEDVERVVLGAVLLSEEALEKALEILRPEDFYKTSHVLIFESIQHLSNSDDAVDLISLIENLKQRDNLDRAGGPPYIASLTSDVPTTSNVEYYSRIIRNNGFRRKLIQITSELTAKAYDESEDTQEIIAEAEKRIFDIMDNSNMAQQYQKADTIVTETVNIIEKLFHAGGDYTGVPTGFSELDQFTSGFQDSEYIVIGARPSVGKTALALTMASYMSVHKKIPVGFFTLEMSGKSLMQRLLSAEAKIDSSRIRNGMLKHSDFSKLTEAAGRLYEAPLYIEDTPNIKLLALRAQARRMKKNENIRAIFIDYIGLIGSDNKNNIPRHEQVAEISRSLKSLARELDIPIIALSQVGRQSEGKEPTLADLRESGSIEQDADVVMFIHKERETDKELEHNAKATIEINLILAKQRNGPIGTCKLVFIPRFTRFESLAKGVKY